MVESTVPKRLAYCGCLYCGKIVGVNPEYCDFCNIGCQIHYQTGSGPDISSAKWLENYHESLPEFEEKMKKWRLSRIKKK